MPIVKTLSKATKLEKEKFTIPKSVQDAIPIQRIWQDGIFQIGSRFSKTFSFTDINYSIAGKEDNWIGGGSYYVLDAAQVADLVNEKLNPYQKEVTAMDLAIRAG